MDVARPSVPGILSPPAARASGPAVAAGPGAAPPVCPLWSALFDAIPLPPLGVAAAGMLLLVGAFLGLDAAEGHLASLADGRLRFWEHVEVRSALVVSLLLAGVVVTHRYESLGTPRDLLRLWPQLERQGACGVPPADALHRRRLAGGLGALVIAAIVPTLYLDPSRFLHAGTYLLPSVMFDLAVGCVLGWTVFKTLYAGLEEDRRFAQLAGRLRHVDLLDLSPLHVFGRRGLRRALRWLLLVSIAALVFVDAGTALPPAVVLAGIFGFATLSFLQPVWGVHRRLQAAKRQELADLRRMICEERGRLRAAGWRPAEAGGRFADLLTYEARIAAARTWPLDASILARLGFYGLLPLGSWLGSALIEHGVGILLR